MEPKYLAISREIEALILSGQGDGLKLPSTRDIAGEHGVSVVTASRALQVLRDKGLIGTVARSRSFLVPETTQPLEKLQLNEHFAVLLRSTPGPWKLVSQASPLTGFATAAREARIRLETNLFDVDKQLSEIELIHHVERAAECGITGLFLMPTRHDVASAEQDELLLKACDQRDIAVVLVERNLRGSNRLLQRDLVATDDVEGGMVSTRHLIDQGRRRIAFITGSPTSSHEGRIAGYLMALFQAARASDLTHAPLVLEQLAGLASKQAYDELADHAIAQKVDGVVCYQDYTAVGLIIELLTRRVRVPEDVAITGFDNLPIGNSFALGVTTYDYPALAIAREAIRVMRARIQDPSRPLIKVLVPGQLIIRNSSVHKLK